MQDWDDITLLRQYVERGSEAAFAALVTRHVNKVYSVALRHTRNPHSAEEITQAVFVILATRSRHLKRGVILSGWLYQTARLTAMTYIRGEIRRARREQEARMQQSLNETESENWTKIAPLLDAAMAGLCEKDRHAVVLRFFDGKSLKEVGLALGGSEDSAKMRVSRAVEKLRRFFTKRGVAVPAAILTAAMAANSVHAAPATLAQTATDVALAKGAAASVPTLTLIKGALKVMAWTKAKSGMATALLAACIIVPLAVQHQAQARMRAGDESLRRQAGQLAGLQSENDRLSDLAANVSLSKRQAEDLRKLRAEVGPLRQQASAVAQLRNENRQLKEKTGQDQPKNPMQIKENLIARNQYGKNWAIAFYQYAQKNGGQFPTSFEQASPFLPDAAKNQADLTTNQLEIVFQGSPASLDKPQDTILFREIDPTPTGTNPDGSRRWAKVYTFADGHTQVQSLPQDGFSAYEQQHMITPASQ
jgi:RNA polymerase sigma factor (sigma-70 family)